MPTEPDRESAIREIFDRVGATVYPDADTLVAVLARGERLRVYLGLDATAAFLHLGHAIQLATLERFRQLGCEVIVLFGDFTAMIGDPTDKTAARTALTKAEVTANIETWRDQISAFVSLTGENAATVKQNSEWLARLGFEDVVSLASHFTVQQMIERDMFERRLGDGQPIHLHEFLYPLMQGYDSVAMDVDVEIGGTDQTFNMLAGRVLQRAYNGREKYVVATNLLVDPDTGTKLMSKSAGDYVALSTPPADMYGRIMALPDSVIVPLFRSATFVPMGDVSEIEDALSRGANPRDAKMRLAREIVSLCHGTSAADAAEAQFQRTFRSGEMPDDAPTISVDRGSDMAAVLVDAGIVPSRSEFRRLRTQRALTDVGTGEKVDTETIDRDMDLRIGKHRFARIRIRT